MNKIFLATRPKYEPTTHYLFHWSQELMELAKSKGFSVLDLSDKRANAKEFATMMAKHEPSFVFLNGHGDDKCVTGHDSEVLVEADKNDFLFSEKVVYALSCRSAKVLGQKSIEKGAVAYIGYNDDFVFYYERDKFSNPIEDKTAGLFLGPSNQFVRSMLKGNTIENSYQRSSAKQRSNIFSLLSSESSDKYLIPFLIWNLRHQECLGRRDISL